MFVYKIIFCSISRLNSSRSPKKPKKEKLFPISGIWARILHWQQWSFISAEMVWCLYMKWKICWKYCNPWNIRTPSIPDSCLTWTPIQLMNVFSYMNLTLLRTYRPENLAKTYEKYFSTIEYHPTTALNSPCFWEENTCGRRLLRHIRHVSLES